MRSYVTVPVELRPESAGLFFWEEVAAPSLPVQAGTPASLQELHRPAGEQDIPTDCRTGEGGTQSVPHREDGRDDHQGEACPGQQGELRGRGVPAGRREDSHALRGQTVARTGRITMGTPSHCRRCWIIFGVSLCSSP